MRPANSGLLSLLALSLAGSVCSQTASSLKRPAQSNVTERPGPTLGLVRGLIDLDAVVIDGSGKLVTGLEPRDFTLLDNGHPSTILSLQPFNETTAKPDPPVEVILLIDTLDLPFKLAVHEGDEVGRFLHQNGGRLAHPVSILGLSNTGLWTLAKPSTDGNALAESIARNSVVPLDRSTLKEKPLNILPLREPAALSCPESAGPDCHGGKGKARKEVAHLGRTRLGRGYGKTFLQHA